MTTTSPTNDRLGPGRHRTSRAQTVADQLSEQILSKKLAAGERLGTKDQMRGQYNVATGTLNEAIRLLETRGLVDAKPGPRGGIFVAQPPAHMRLSHLILGLGADGLSVADSLEVRDALEAPVALHASRNARAADISRLRKLIATMGDCDDDPWAYLRANWDLHESIADLAGNQLLRTIYISLLDTAREGVREVLPDDQYRAVWRLNWQLHVDLVDAIASGDQALVIAAAEAHRPLSSTTLG